MERIASYSQLEALLLSLTSRSTLSNDFNLKPSYQHYIDDKRLYYIQQNNNLFLLLEKDGFFQAYFHLNNNQGVYLSSDLEVVLEIPYRNYNRPNDLITHLNSIGFVDHIERHLYTANFQNYPKLKALDRNISLKLIDDTVHADYIQGLIMNTFDKYTGDVLRKDQVIARIENGEILAVWEDELPVAFLEFYLKGKVGWIGHVVVDQHKRGRGYGTLLVESYLKMLFERRVQRFHQWVMADNESAIKMYKRLGFTYGNKSSFSMLKK